MPSVVAFKPYKESHPKLGRKMAQASERPDIERLMEVFALSEHCRLNTPFARLCRCYRFLHLIIDRYEEVNRQYVESSRIVWEVFNRGTSGTAFTEEECVILDENRFLHDKLHLEIESFYIFAKVFLDRTAQYIQSHFGRLPGKKRDLLRSHHSLIDNLSTYAEAKDLQVSQDLLTAAAALQASIISVRDRYIVHDDSDRTMHGTLTDAKGRSRLTVHRINPHEHERQGVKTEPLGDLMLEIDKYVSMAIEMMRSQKTSRPAH